MADKKDRRAGILADSQTRVKEQTEEQNERGEAQPTPTQEENDRAKLGVENLNELDKKEDDGTDEQPNAGQPNPTKR